MERNIISWNITNWLTILLMVAIGYAVIGGVVALAKTYGVSFGTSGGGTAMADNASLAS